MFLCLNSRHIQGQKQFESTIPNGKQREKEILESAREEVVTLTRRAETQIAQERKKAYQEIKNEISDISVAIAGKMVQREIKAEDHEALISQFIENVGEA